MNTDDKIVWLQKAYFAAQIMLHNGSNIIRNFTKKGKCSRCGQCCSNLLPLSNDEAERLKSLADKKNQKQIRTSCPFLTEAFSCSIYQIRPLICKTFKCNIKEPSYKVSRIFAKEKRELVDVWTLIQDKN